MSIQKKTQNTPPAGGYFNGVQIGSESSLFKAEAPCLITQVKQKANQGCPKAKAVLSKWNASTS